MSRLSKVFDKAKEEPQEHNESKKALNKEFVNLNFKVDAEVRRKIKTYAAHHDMSLKEVFEAALDFYMKHHP
jgi:predicted HicB family RNase H-like nuclease